MPVTIYPSTLKIKDTNGTFHGADCIKGDTGPQGPHGSPIDVQVDGVSVVTNDVAHIDISGKTDKVNNATVGNFAGLDAAGNLVDSGKGPDDITGAAPAIVKSASGAIASFENGAEKPVESLVVGIEPVQDLHGYDSPWPAGSTKNKMPNAIPKTETINGITFKLDDFGVFTVTGTATDEAICDFPIGFSFVIPDGEPKPKVAFNNTHATSATFRFYNNSTQVDSWSLLPVNRVQEYVNMRGKTCNSYKILVPSGATVDMTISPMLIENSVTDYTYIPYSNICPISGWTGAKVTRTGKNLLNIDESLMISVGYNRYFPISLAAGTYTITCFGTFGNGFGSAIDLATSDKRMVLTIAPSYAYGRTQGASYSFSLTQEQANKIAMLTMRVNGSGITFPNIVAGKLQIEYGTVSTTYESYQGETYDITFPTEARTVYGGTLDVTNGTLTVDRATVDLGTLSWSKNGDRFTVATKIVPNPQNVSVWNANNPMAICSAYKYGNIGNGNGVDKAIGFYAGYLYARDTAYENADDFKNGCSGIQLVYQLETPITYTLTPQEITTLLGSNRIWADCGNTAVDYCADTKMYVDGAVPVQDVQVNGTSILSNGVANIPLASETNNGTAGVVKSGPVVKVNSDGVLITNIASVLAVKNGTNQGLPITPSRQHEAAFYGLAKVAGDTTQSQSNNAAGTYTDTAKDKIQQMLGIDSLVARHEGTAASSGIAVGETFIFNGKLYSATSAIAEGDAIAPGVNCSETTLANSAVRDVQIDGTSVLSNGVVNIPKASASAFGLIKAGGALRSGTDVIGGNVNAMYVQSVSLNGTKIGTSGTFPVTPSVQHASAFYGLAKAAGDTTQSQSDNAVGTYTDDAKSAIRSMLGAVGDTDYASGSNAGVIKIGEGVYMTNGALSVIRATDGQVKIGAASYRPIVPVSQHLATFYGLAKAAGDTTQTSSDNAVGTYTETAQSKIHEMLDAPVTVSGTDPVITGKAGIRYVCGECATLTFTPPASGIVDIVFESGTTPTVLSGVSNIKWPSWFNPESLQPSVTYELNIMDGRGVVGVWT